MEGKILVVEDDMDMRELLDEYLGDNGFEVDAAATGKEAMEKFRATKPHLVLLDVVLPDMNGFDVCKQMKELSKSVKIIVYTGKVDAVDAAKARKAGADDFVVKTQDLSYVIESVRKLLAKK